jgi:hypothetical protein
MLSASNLDRNAITAAFAAVVIGLDGAARPLDRRIFDGLALAFMRRIAPDLLKQLLPGAAGNDAGEIETPPALSGGAFVRLVAAPDWRRWRLERLPEAAGALPEIIAAGTCPADLLGRMICPGARRPDWLSLIGAASLLLHASEDSNE